MSVLQTSDLGDRRTYLGATDIAAIVGLSTYASPISVLREKVEGLESSASDRAEWGKLARAGHLRGLHTADRPGSFPAQRGGASRLPIPALPPRPAGAR